MLEIELCVCQLLYEGCSTWFRVISVFESSHGGQGCYQLDVSET